MREQVIASRGSRRPASQPRGFVQRPARRDNSGAARTRNFSVRTLFAYIPSALKFVLAILVLITLVVGYRVAASASMFQARNIDVTGTTRTSAEEIEGFTHRAVARTGVWRADLSAISAELGKLPGVRRAVVSRVLPDRLRVRVTERVPIAVVRTAAGHFVWVDDEGVALGEMKPNDPIPTFFIRGWNEDGTDEARKENIERVETYLEVVREWGAVGLSERVSEVNLTDTRDVRAQLAGDDSQIEVRLGGQELGKGLKIALENLDAYKQTPRGSSITYVDLQTGRVIIGFSSGGKISTGTETPAADSKASDANSTVKPASASPNKTKAENPKASDNQQKGARNTTGRDNKPGNDPRIRLR